MNYSIVWERRDYDIRNGLYGQAYFRGPKRKGAWNLNIGSRGSKDKSTRYATIHRAAYRYFYGNIGGIKRPNVWSKLKFSYFHKESNRPIGGDNWGNWDFTGLFPDIRIFGKSNGTWRRTDGILGTTFHEIGHASHIELLVGAEIQFAFVSKIIRESWPEAIEWHLSKLEYGELGLAGYDRYERDKQNWTGVASENQQFYTPLFIDMIDTYDQSKAGTLSIYPKDKVRGYTLSQIERNILQRTYRLRDLQGQLKTVGLPAGVKAKDIDDYFGFYYDLGL